jgi:hypothetical protein
VALQSTVVRPVVAQGTKQVYRSNPFTNQSGNDPKMRSNDRIIVLSSGKKGKVYSSTGLVDHRIYTGEVKLHAVLGPTGLWTLHLDKGSIPPSLEGSWTRWDDCLAFVTKYFKTRNIEVIEVKD